MNRIRQPLVSKPMGWIANIRQFWREVVQEMKKVSWPTRTEVGSTTIIRRRRYLFRGLYLGIGYLLSYLIGIEWLAQKFSFRP